MSKGRQKRSPAAGRGSVLGIECGATHSRALLVAPDGHLVWEGSAGPGNLQLLSETALGTLLRRLRGPLSCPAAVAIGMAGARTSADEKRVLRTAARIWPGVPVRASNDLETGLAAGRPDSPVDARAWILVLSGTGSCCFGRAKDGRTAKVGGWGHLLGDRGSAYDIGLTGVRCVLTEFDRLGKWPRLGERLVRALLLNSPEELVGWAPRAEKHEVAALAREVFGAWQDGDRLASRVVDKALNELLEDAHACAARLSARRGPTAFVLAGGVLVGQPRFAKRLRAGLLARVPRSSVHVLHRESVWGAVQLARDLARRGDDRPIRAGQQPEGLSRSVSSSPTEQRNPRSMTLHRMPLEKAVTLMLTEEAKVVPALLKHRSTLVRAVKLIVQAFRAGGRLFYVGAGTSGRLGVLDASECPPTFRTPPEMVQGIMAGGHRALWESVEGAEDDAEAGSQAVAARGLRGRDVLVGIAASGRTPFVWGALGEARRLGARTVLVCFNPGVAIPKGARPNVVLAVGVGPEVLTGSTRLKAGTATKLVLNILTTLSMVRMGKVFSNLMIDVNPSNEKLKDRAQRIVRAVTGLAPAAAREALERTRWDVKAACAGGRRRRGK